MARLIAITGGSGAGKTTIARALVELLGAGAALLAEDDYYRCATTIPGFDPARHNFDAPAAKDDALLLEHLRRAHAGEGFEKPLYDLVTHTRRAKMERLGPADFLIVEGIHVLAFPELRELFAVRIFVHAEESLRLGRRMIRDVQMRGREPQAVLDQFFATVRPMHERHVEPQRAFADLTLVSTPDAGQEQANAHALEIKQRLEAREPECKS